MQNSWGSEVAQTTNGFETTSFTVLPRGRRILRKTVRPHCNLQNGKRLCLTCRVCFQFCNFCLLAGRRPTTPARCFVRMQMGSASLVIQADAEYMAQAGLNGGAALSVLKFVPGTRMMEEGVDATGRCVLRGGEADRGTSARAVDRGGTRAAGRHARVDDHNQPFAANRNRFVPGFTSWTGAPDSEAVDAFAIA